MCTSMILHSAENFASFVSHLSIASSDKCLQRDNMIWLFISRRYPDSLVGEDENFSSTTVRWEAFAETMGQNFCFRK